MHNELPVTQPGGDGQASRKNHILRAAVDEFSRKGFAGVRVDEIASRAGCNKQLIYYYFGSKAKLYDAVLTEMVEETARLWHHLEGANVHELVEAQVARQRPRGRSRWRRLLAWEGIEYGAHRPHAISLEKIRTDAYGRQTAILRREQERGAIAPDVDIEMLSLFIIIATTGTEVLPQITKMVTGQEVSDPEFNPRLRAFMLDIVDRLADPPSAPGPAGAVANRQVACENQLPR